MDSYEFDDSILNTWWLVRQARESMYKAVSASLARYQCTIEQFEVLIMISRQPGGVTLGELARWLAREKHSAAGLLSRAEKAGLIFREKPEGCKHYIYRLTAKGEKVMEEAWPVVKDIMGEMGQRFSEDELREIRRYMKLLRDMYLERLLGVRNPVLI
ncbi:MAG: MarR family transcriptional regulator [Dehalococcoidia bacterium]|nr:MarR family transcriptional regulator [Dehalococcoidia bacterium]